MSAYLKAKNPAFDMSSFFDVYTGASAGAYVLTYFLVTKKSPEEFKLFFRDNVAKIMQHTLRDIIFGIYQSKPKYDGKVKGTFIKTFVENHTFGSFDASKIVVVTGFNLKTQRTQIFNSSKVNKALLTRDVLDASSAAPCYYPCVFVPNCHNADEPPSDAWFLDGGLEANNPTLCGLAEIPPDRAHRRRVVINIGTGYKLRKVECEKAHMFGTYQWLASGLLTMPPQGQLVEQLTSKLLPAPNVYINVDGVLPDTIPWEVDTCTAKDMQNMILFGEALWETHKGKFANFFDL